MTCPNCGSILEELYTHSNPEFSNESVRVFGCTDNCKFPNNRWVLDKDYMGKYNLERLDLWNQGVKAVIFPQKIKEQT